jgi:FkbM family methyltransferase
MIKLIHSPENSETPFGSLKAEMQNPMNLNIMDEPIEFRVISSISGKTQWKSNLYPGCWSYYGMISNTTSQITRKGEILCEFVWDTFLHGDLAHQYMMLWAKENKGAFGIAIGTHNGETGEWVDPLRKGLIEGVLVEASDSQFFDLVENYKEIKGCHLLKSLITSDGGEFTFWESEDASYTNSIIKDHADKHSGEVKGKIMESISLNNLIESQGREVSWLHLDVEGIDAELILSLTPNNIDKIKFIIYETLNTVQEEKERCKKFLEINGFSVKESGWNTIAIKNND